MAVVQMECADLHPLGADKDPFDGDSAGFCRQLSFKVQLFAGEDLQGLCCRVVVAAVIGKCFAGALRLKAHGVQIPGIGPVHSPEKKRRSEQVKGDEEQGQQGLPATGQLQRWRLAQCSGAFPPQGCQQNQPAGADHRSEIVVSVDQVEAEKVPVERGNNIDAVAPFILQGIEEQVEEAVAAKQGKDQSAAPGKKTECRRYQQAVDQARLSCNIKTQGKRLKEIGGLKQMKHDPRHIRQDTADKNPWKIFRPLPGWRALQCDVA